MRGVLILLMLSLPLLGAEKDRVRVLLLGGSTGEHNPAAFAKMLADAVQKNNIELTYTEDLNALTPENLGTFDVLAIYRDGREGEELSEAREAALVGAVEGGTGFVAIGGAARCFLKSERYGKLIGGRPGPIEVSDFRARIIDAQHAATRNVRSFTSRDETMTHSQLSNDLRVLMARVRDTAYEPVTWVRTAGKGRVFYTALGRDESTWKQADYQRLLEQAIRWAAKKTDPLTEPVLSKGEMQVVPGSGKTVPPLSPAESMAAMHMPEGFRVELFASEPRIVRPLAMAFDARGRVWIAESVDYPNNVVANSSGNDRIKICEDTDGDGAADRFTVFADKLNIPTTLAFGGGGLIVGQAPHILLLKDTNGDDVADERTILYTGFGRSDTHAVISNFSLGLDNWMWGVCGYSGGDVTVNGQTSKFGQCCFRFKTDGSAFEVLTSTSNNTWGLGFNSEGDCFISTANNQHAVYLGIPNRAYESVRGWHGNGSAGIDNHKPFHAATGNVRQGDFFGAFTAAAGMTPYTARSYPPEYWERAAFVCEPTGHLIHIDWLEARGSSFVAHNGFNLMAGSDPWIAPIQTVVGPDGAVWVVDWYNYIIIHNNPYVKSKHGAGNAVLTDLRDQSRGRIYRIVHESMRPALKPALATASPRELVRALGDDNKWVRSTAQRLLIERGKAAVLAELAAMILAVEDVKFSEYRAIHVLWTMHGLGAFSTPAHHDVLRTALLHSPPAVTRVGLEVLPRTVESAAWIVKHGLLKNPDPKVRRAALLALGEMPPVIDAGLAIAAMLAEPRNFNDPWIPAAGISAAARNDFDFLKAALANGNEALASPVRVVAEHYARGAPVDSVADVVAMLAQAPKTLLNAVLTGLDRGWLTDKTPGQTGRMEGDLAALAKKLDVSQQTAVVKLARKWEADGKLKEAMADVKKSLLQQASNHDLSDGQRVLALRQLVSLGVDDEGAAAALKLISPKINPSLAAGIITELSAGTNESLAQQIVKRWPTLSPQSRGAALAALLKRAAWSNGLLDAIDKGALEQSDLNPDQVQQLVRHPDTAIAARTKDVFSRKGRLPDADRQKVVETFLTAANQVGDPVVGKVVFQNNCAKCHRVGDTGAHVGPELDGLGARDKAGIVIDILDPNRSVEGNFRTYTVKTTDGRVFSGLMKSENKNSVELLDSDAKSVIVQRSDIEKMIASPLSLMPEGFEKIGDVDLAHLLEFLTAKGKFFPLPLEKVATFPSSKRMFLGLGDEEKLIFPRWGFQSAFDIPFNVLDPQGGKRNNVILLHGPMGEVSKAMPHAVRVPCNTAALAIHLLSGVSGWGHPALPEGSVSLIVRIHYNDGQDEDHALLNGVHFTDYISAANEVKESKLAFTLRDQQIRYLAIKPKRPDRHIREIEFVKGTDESAPVVMAVTVEREGK